MRTWVVSLGLIVSLVACGGGDDEPDASFSNKCGPVDENVDQENTLLPSITLPTTLKESCSPYFLNPQVPSTVIAAEVEIEPGVTIIGGMGGLRNRITVGGNGLLLAEGTSSKPITFTSEFDGTSPRGQWTGILFLEAAPGSRLVNVVINLGGGPYSAALDDDEFNRYEFPVEASLMNDSTRDLHLENVTIQNGRGYAMAATTADGFETSDADIYSSVTGLTILNTASGIFIPVDQTGNLGPDICFVAREDDGTCSGGAPPEAVVVEVHLDDRLGRTPENVTRDATWFPLATPHVVDAINVTNNAVLTFEDGMDVRMTGFGGIAVGVNGPGALIAKALTPGSIKIGTVSEAPAEHWDGISIWQDAVDTVTHIENVDIGYGGDRSLDSNQAPANIQIFNANPTIVGNHVHHSLGMGIHWNCASEPPGLDQPPLPSTNTVDTATIGCATSTSTDGIAPNFGCPCPMTGCQDRCQ